MNNKSESLTILAALSFGVLGITGIFVLSGCTMNLPPANEPIPTADPILLPEKTATGNSSNSDTTNTQPVEVVPSTKAASASTVNNQSGVNEKKGGQSSQGQTYYVVKPKDTVFEVMRQTGVHWKEIIRLNNLKAPKYTIFPGQSLRIK